MKRNVSLIVGASLLWLWSAPVMAGSVALPNTFSPNTPAKADSVNENFSALAVEVNDNDARLNAVEEMVYFGVRRDSVYTKSITSVEVVNFSSGSTVWANQGAAFNATNSMFTAPADGLYTFNGAVYFQGLTVGDLIYVQIEAGGRRFYGGSMDATNQNHIISASTTVYMTAGQNARLWAYAPAGTDFYGNTSSAYQFTWFSGAKVK